LYDLLGRAGETHGLDEGGGDEARLDGIEEAVVTAVQALMPLGGRRLLEPREVALPDGTRVLGRVLAGLQMPRDQIVETREDRRAALGHDALGVEGFTRPAEGEGDHGRSEEVRGESAPGLRGSALGVGRQGGGAARAREAGGGPTGEST